MELSEPSTKPHIIIENEEQMPAIKRGPTNSNKIGFDELQTHIANIDQHWSWDFKLLRCPVCRFEVKADTFRKACNHLMVHLGDKALFPYHCPINACDHVALILRHIQGHVKQVHKLNWTDRLAASSVLAENKARLDALFDDNCEDGTLLGKRPPPGPPLIAASATFASTGTPSTSKGPPATSSRQVSCGYGSPPPKVRRQTAQVVKGATLAGAPLKTEQVLMSKKQAKREYAAVFSPSSSATKTPRALQKTAMFTDLANQQVAQSDPKAPRKRAATKQLNPKWLDSGSDSEGSSSNEFQPDADHISEDDVEVDDLSDLDADDQNVGDASSETGESLACYDGTQTDSVQVTIFNCLPPRIPCCDKLPELKLFHELSEDERREFEFESDKIKAKCHFCGEESRDNREDSGGTSRIVEHYYRTQGFFKCTWPGCTKKYSRFDALQDHYKSDHDPSLCRWKCDKCKYTSSSQTGIESHMAQPHPTSRTEALAAKSLNPSGKVVVWKDPQFCHKCDNWYPRYLWTFHKRHHEREQFEFDRTKPVQGIQIVGLRDDKCPFDGCDETYLDFTGWYLHCLVKHNEYISFGGYAPSGLTRQTSNIPLYNLLCVYSDRAGTTTPCAMPRFDAPGNLIKQRASAYGVQPEQLKLEYGFNRMAVRQLTGLLKEASDHTGDAQLTESFLSGIRRDPFLRSFAKRCRNAPAGTAVYCVAKIRKGITPGLCDWVKDRIIYVGSTRELTERAALHIQNSIAKWHDMGLKLAPDEELYMFRMSIALDEQTSVRSFNVPDYKRLEQIVIDALGMGTLFNTERVLASATLLNDTTYRNHLAPRLNQLALLLLASTYSASVKNGINVDGENVLELPIIRKGLNFAIRQAPGIETGRAMGCAACPNAKGSDAALCASSPIPAPRILSPEVHDVLTRYRDELGLTEQELFDRLRARRSSTSTGRREESIEPPLQPAESALSCPLNQRPDSSLDMFAYLYDSEEAVDRSPTDCDPFDFANVPTTSNGPEYRVLEEHRTPCADVTTSHRAEHEESNELHMSSDESVRTGIPLQPSPNRSDSLSSSEVSASMIASVRGASGSVPPPIIRQCTLRITSYGGRGTQYVDLARAPVDLTQDAPSEASHDEPSPVLSDESSETSDEETPREILDDSSESSLDEPSPTDSGFFDFEHVPSANHKHVIPNAEDSVVKPIPKDSAENASAALPSDDVDEEEADSDTHDQCAHNNCRRPQYKNINWVQCDDCDEWYHSVCILRVEKEVEEDEFHCGCTKRAKRKSMRAHRSKKQ